MKFELEKKVYFFFVEEIVFGSLYYGPRAKFGLDMGIFSVPMCFINSYNLVFTSRTSITQFIINKQQKLVHQ
jgi:hypothetical protein